MKQMQKHISTIAVMVLVFIVPFGSWYYLKQGLDYRKDALVTLAPKDSIDSRLDTLAFFRGKTTIVVNKSSDDLDKLISTIKDQFKNTPKFQVVYKDSSVHNSGIIIPKMYLNDFFKKYQDRQYLLIDEKLKLRNVFGFDKESTKKLIEHTAIILPRPKEADIEVKQ